MAVTLTSSTTSLTLDTVEKIEFNTSRTVNTYVFTDDTAGILDEGKNIDQIVLTGVLFDGEGIPENASSTLSFGYITEPDSATKANLSNDNFILGNHSQSPAEDGWVTRMEMYCESHPSYSGNMKLLLYTQSGSLVAETTEFSSSTPSAWYGADVVTESAISSTTSYVVCFWYSNDQLYMWRYSATDQGAYISDEYDGDVPNSVSWTNTEYDYNYCIKD